MAYMRENVTEIIALKVHVDNFFWWDVSQEMHFSYYANTTTTLVWFSKYRRFNIGQCSQHLLFLICSVCFRCKTNLCMVSKRGGIALYFAHRCTQCPCTRHGIQYSLCMCTFLLVANLKLRNHAPRFTYS